MPGTLATHITANEAASVTGVPLRQVHRIIDAGLLGAAVKRSRNARLLARRALVGLKLAHETADVLTPASRREVVAALIRHPRQVVVRADMIAVDTKPAAKAVRAGLDQLVRARRLVTSARDVLGGAPVFKGTRIPVLDIADMLANGDSPAQIIRAYPQLDAEKLKLAAVYSQAYPRRGRPRAEAAARALPLKTSETFALSDLVPA